MDLEPLVVTHHPGCPDCRDNLEHLWCSCPACQIALAASADDDLNEDP